MPTSSICPIDRNLSGTPTPGQSGPSVIAPLAADPRDNFFKQNYSWPVIPVSREISPLGPLGGFRAQADKEILWPARTLTPNTTNGHIVSH